MQIESTNLGYTWQVVAGVLPHLVSVMYYQKPAGGLSGRISHPFWVLDYSRSPCGRVRVGAASAPWRERLPGIAHLYPPGTAYWEDRRRIATMEGAYAVFLGGELAGLRKCVVRGQRYARIADPDGVILEHLHAAARAGGERGDAGFWEAQAALCSLLQVLQRVEPQGRGADAAMVPNAGPAVSVFVKEVNSHLAGRLNGRATLAAIAASMNVSPSTLAHRYAAESGQSPLSAFRRMRLDVARSLIVRGLKLEAVAAQTGFCDAYHLSKAFTRQFTVSPAAYRRRAGHGL